MTSNTDALLKRRRYVHERKKLENLTEKYLLDETPIEKYLFGNKEVFVKREDLACLPPGPPFAKVRGLLPFLINLKTNGCDTVGYMETSVSMATWGISYFCKIIDLRAVVVYPEYTEPRENQKFQFEKWKEFGAEVYPLKKPNRMQINFYRARKFLKEKYPDSFMLPLGLPFPETVIEVTKQTRLLDQYYGSIVICIGSGTMAAGVLKGLGKIQTTVYGVLASPKNEEMVRKKIYKIGEMPLFSPTGLFKGPKLTLIDTGLGYTEKDESECPFPCNNYYDRKAWGWLLRNYDKLEKPVLFWNIGSDYQ